MASPSRTRISRMRPATLAATAESSPSTRPVSSTTLDGVDGEKNRRQTTSPTIARAATAMNGATFLLDAVWLEPDACATRSSAILVSQVSRHLRANYPLVNANLICPAWKPAWVVLVCSTERRLRKGSFAKSSSETALPPEEWLKKHNEIGRAHV